MQVYKDLSKNYNEDPICFFNFENTKHNNFNFYYGISNLNKKTDCSFFNVYFDLEEPSSSLDDYPRIQDNNFNLVLSICPYTCDYLNSNYSNNRIFTFFPFNEDYIIHSSEKKYDVIYTGQVHADKISSYLEVISSFNYKAISFTNHKFATDINVDYNTKLRLLSESRVSVIHNLIFPQPHHIQNIKSAKNFGKNKAFEYVDEGIYPQLKSRSFEAAFCKTLMLVQRDKWNIVEHFFEPNTDFLYFDSAEEMRYIIDDVCKNYAMYESIIENAFNKAIQFYTTRHFYSRYLLQHDL